MEGKPNKGHANVTDPEIKKRSHSKEANVKRAETRAKNKLIQGELYDYLKGSLVGGDTPYYQEFIDRYLKDALAKPAGLCGKTVASAIFTDQLLDKLDSESNKLMSKDLDFMKYRILKRAFAEQYNYLIDDNSPTICLICSRRAGKTASTALKLALDAANPGHNSVYIHRTFQSAIDQCWSNLIEVCDEVGLDIAKEDKGNGLITFANGSTVKFFGNSDRSSADKLLGFKFNKAIIDETQNQVNLDYLIFTVLEPTFVGQDHAQLILQGTQPRTPGTFWEAEINNKNVKHYSWTMFQNTFLSDPTSLIESICKERGVDKSAPFIQREFYNQPAYDIEAQIFKDYKTYVTIPKDFVPTNIYIGTDYGFGDKTAIIALECDERDKANPVAYVTKELKFNNTGATDILLQAKNLYEEERTKMLNIGQDPENVTIITDTNEKTLTYDMYKTYHMKAYCAYKYDKQGSIDRLSQYMRTGKLYIPENGMLDDECKKTIWKRDDNDNIMFGTIDDDSFHPDALDSLRYASVQYDFDCGGKDSKQAKSVAGTTVASASTLPPWMQASD